MPSFEKSPPEFVTYFQDIIRDFPQVEVRMMFGYPCAFVNTHMATGLFADKLFVHLSPTDEKEFMAIPGAASFAPMQNRPMKGYVLFPGDMLATRLLVKKWITRSLVYLVSLPAKPKTISKKRM